MKVLYISLFSCLICSSLAKPTSPVNNHPDYSTPNSTRSEARNQEGEIQGAYNYVDDKNINQSAQYTTHTESGSKIAAINLSVVPLPVKDAQEVVAAPQVHLKQVTNVSNTEVEKVKEEIITGRNNIFLQGLIPNKKKPVESEGKTEKPIIQKVEMKHVVESEPQKETIIGQNNIFLQGLIPNKLKPVESEGKTEKPIIQKVEMKHVVESEPQKETMIGQNNIFLQGLIPNQLKPVESEGKTEKPIIQKVEMKNLTEPEPQSAKEVIQNDEKANSQENSEIVPQVTPTRVEQEDSIAPADIPASEINLESNQDTVEVQSTHIEEPKPSKPEQEDTFGMLHETIVPINIFPLEQAYSTLVSYSHLPYIQYTFYNNP